MFTLFEAIEKGGFVMYILCAFSVYSIAVAIYKLVQFYRAGLLFGNQTEQATAFALDNQPKKAIAAISERHPAYHALRVLYTKNTPEHAAVLGNKAFRYIDSHIRALEIVAAVAPLLGLLGTVIGMVKAFSGISAGGANVDPGMLAGGIWEALLTTIAGLAVAIPAMIIAHILQGRSEHARAQIEEIAALITPKAAAPTATTDVSEPKESATVTKKVDSRPEKKTDNTSEPSKKSDDDTKKTASEN